MSDTIWMVALPLIIALQLSGVFEAIADRIRGRK